MSEIEIQMTMSPTIAAITEALLNAKRVFPPIPKDKTAKLGSYSYKYADLGNVLDKTDDPLADNGLVLIQPYGGPNVVTLLLHMSGEWFRSVAPLTAFTTPQELGAATTYIRRYAAQAMLGITTEEDTDGQGVGAPAEDKAPSGPTALASAKQVNMIAGKAKERDVAEAVVNALITKKWGAEHPRKLTKAQASEFIDWITKSDDDTLDAAVTKVMANQEATG